MIEAETLVSIEELLNSTAAAVQPDDQIYAIVDASDPDAVGEISFREQARKVHFVAFAEAVNQGRITARSMATRIPFREWPPAHLSWERACEVHGVTQADADKFCAELALNRQQLPQPQAAAPAPVVADSPDDGESWKAKARQRADEIIKRQRAKDLHPNQEAIADEIAREFRTDGVVGAGGKPLTGAYIKRHALNGISSAAGKQLSTSIRRGK